jgi:lipid II:glycine glycyltransferase (peptidoglycan interpeptide bridge formation enzyme)
MPCDRNTGEICGGGNRILIYQDAAWVLLTDLEFAAQLQALEALLQQLQVLIQKWSQDLQTYNTTLQAATTQNQKKKRATISVSQAGMQVNLDQQEIIALLKGQPISKHLRKQTGHR